MASVWPQRVSLTPLMLQQNSAPREKDLLPFSPGLDLGCGAGG